MAPGRVRLRTDSTTIRHSSASIIHLEMRSRPFCRPMLHTAKPKMTVTAIQGPTSKGLASISLNTPPTAWVSSPAKVPVRNLKK